MNARTAREALAAFLAALQRALSCVTPAIVVVPHGGSVPSGDAHCLTLSGSPVRLGGRTPITLRLDFHYRLAHVSDPRASRRVQPASYFYTLDAVDGHEIVADHWHPEGASHVITPHVHLGVGAGRLRPELTTAHLPTGMVTIEAVLQLAIEAFGVRPLRPDWAEILSVEQISPPFDRTAKRQECMLRQ